MVVDKMQIADTLHLRDVAMATPFCLSMGYNFGCMIARDTLLILGVVFGFKLSGENIADFELLRDVAMTTIFGFLYVGCTLAPPEKYDVRRRCGLMSNYFDHLFEIADPDLPIH